MRYRQRLGNSSNSLEPSLAKTSDEKSIQELPSPLPRVRRTTQPAPTRSQLNLNVLNKTKQLSECENSLEFIIVSICKAFDFKTPQEAVKFLAGGINSPYGKCLTQMVNFERINTFLRLLFTNVKTLIRILESENDHQNVKSGSNGIHIPEKDSSHSKIMNLIAMALIRSQDYRIVWQTCILLSGIFQNLNGLQINFSFQTLMIRWAMNQDDDGNFKGASDEVEMEKKGQTVDFIKLCLIAREKHSELAHEIINLFYEVANIGRSKRKWERQNDNSQLVELFSVILPQYFTAQTMHHYFDLIHDIILSHHFQIEKDRIDKQHLLFKTVDSCLHKLSIINEAKDKQQLLDSSINVRQSAMSLICTIWSNHQHIFRHTLSRFIAHFEQVFKPNGNVIKSLHFDYSEYSQATKVGKIVLLLLKRNLKDSNKLVKVTTLTQLFGLLEQFTKRDELDLQNVVFKLLALQLIDSYQNAQTKDVQEVREIISNFLGQYILSHCKPENLTFLLDLVKDYLKGTSKLQGKKSSAKETRLQGSDYYLLSSLVNSQNPIQTLQGVFEGLSHVILSESFFELTTLKICQRVLTKLVAKMTESPSEIKQLLQKTISLLQNYDDQIRSKDLNDDMSSNLKLKRQVLVKLILKVIKVCKDNGLDLRHHTQELMKDKSSTTKGFFKHLAEMVSKIEEQDLVSNVSLIDTKRNLKDLGQAHISLKVNSEAIGLLQVQQQDRSRERLAPVKTITRIQGPDVIFKKQETTRSKGILIQDTTRFVEGPLSMDMNDQSSQTTLRTEIYTSEDEDEMMQYYIYLSTYKKTNLDIKQPVKTYRSAKSDESNKPVKEDRRSEAQSSLKDEISMALKRSNSLSQFHQSIKLMDEAPLTGANLVRTKEQLMKPELGRKKSKKKYTYKRTSSMNCVSRSHSRETDSSKEKAQGQYTDRLLFRNKLRFQMDSNSETGSHLVISPPKVAEFSAKRDSSRKSSPEDQKKKLRVDPNSNYQLKTKYISQEPILEESLEQSAQKILDSLGKNQQPQAYALKAVPEKLIKETKQFKEAADKVKIKVLRNNKSPETAKPVEEKTTKVKLKKQPSIKKKAPVTKKTEPKKEDTPIRLEQRPSVKVKKLHITKIETFSAHPPKNPEPNPKQSTPVELEEAKNALKLFKSPSVPKNKSPELEQMRVSQTSLTQSKPNILVKRPSSRRSKGSLHETPPKPDPTNKIPPSTKEIPRPVPKEYQPANPSPITKEVPSVIVEPNSGIDSMNDRVEMPSPIEQVTVPAKVKLSFDNMEKTATQKVFITNKEAETAKHKTQYEQQLKSLGFDVSQDLSAQKQESGTPAISSLKKERLTPIRRESQIIDASGSLIKIPGTTSPVTASRVDSSASPSKDAPIQSNQYQGQPNEFSFTNFLQGMQQLALMQQNLQSLMNQLAFIESQNQMVGSRFQEQQQAKTPPPPRHSIISDDPARHDRRIHQMKAQAALSNRSVISSVSQPNLQPWMRQRHSLQNTISMGALAQQKQQIKHKKRAMRDFTETLKSIRQVSADQLETMSQKASDRIAQLKQKRMMAGSSTPQNLSRSPLGGTSNSQLNFSGQAKAAYGNERTMNSVPYLPPIQPQGMMMPLQYPLMPQQQQFGQAHSPQMGYIQYPNMLQMQHGIQGQFQQPQMMQYQPYQLAQNQTRQPMNGNLTQSPGQEESFKLPEIENSKPGLSNQSRSNKVTMAQQMRGAKVKPSEQRGLSEKEGQGLKYSILAPSMSYSSNLVQTLQ